MRFSRIAILVLAIFAVGSAVSAGTLARIYIYPGFFALLPGSQQQFKVAGLDALGNKVTFTDRSLGPLIQPPEA